MTDLLVWFVTVGVALIVLRYIPMNLPMKGRMIVWLTGSLISSLALLATITYTFWMGILAALVLGVVFAVFLQEKAPRAFAVGQETTEESSDEKKIPPQMEDYENRYRNDNDDEHLIEDDELSGRQTDKGPVQDENFPQENPEKKEEGILVPETTEVERSKSSDSKDNLDEYEEPIQEEESHDGFYIEDVKMQGDVFGWAGDDESLLLDEELSRLRMEEQSVVDGEKFEDSEEVTEEELMAGRNLQLDMEEHGPKDKVSKSEKLPRVKEDTQESIVEDDLESEEEIINEIYESTNSDNDITREMSDQDEGMSVDHQEVILSPHTYQNLDADKEDDEDSLALEEGQVDELFADGALRKKLLQLLIEKIEYMEGQMTGVEYEDYVKAHLSEQLPDLEYYSVSKYLVKYYIKYEKTGELELFIGELINKFASYPLLVEELSYVLHQQVQYTK
ncbi:hypothetical protein GLW00_15250 [Halobacillus litoralis]|uniref:Uncharacterized protein n=1 Tax=Halobacillus litoralis TaxID=45668 RepID=A0A845FEA9_9BACI|nr:hypothetical protein [Halobacillus litoralis]MYL72201.1 hypothetical protein [Halobacillus litoralis]